ncbi:uncharacterized protein LOC124459055 [Xenia sp. Carnegie-2017]|uniref:uncharacterized protein LOC124459055 n=1 Tax=Xenia sp. Carnegie-2017 TaxID=2897299 RepID=UPI001F05030E|nr:uncharacterized protein LOC124459055 [Xenia sp. Carnegie-2017]
MISYSFPEMFCRHILVVTHFESNLERDNQEINGVPQVKVHYSKFINGEAVVRNVKVAQDFGYVVDIYQVLCSALIDEETLRKAKGDLLRMTPLPMNSMLDKQSKSEAISKKARRQSMPAVHFPPTKPAEVSPVEEKITDQRKERAAPRCTVCKNWMKGHKNIMNCPKNQK